MSTIRRLCVFPASSLNFVSNFPNFHWYKEASGSLKLVCAYCTSIAWCTGTKLKYGVNCPLATIEKIKTLASKSKRVRAFERPNCIITFFSVTATQLSDGSVQFSPAEAPKPAFLVLTQRHLSSGRSRGSVIGMKTGAFGLRWTLTSVVGFKNQRLKTIASSHVQEKIIIIGRVAWIDCFNF